MGSAKRTSSGGRAGRRRERAAFFTAPSAVAQRRYEALRAYFVEEASASEVAQRFGYAPSTVVAMVRDFIADPAEFFVERRPGPRVAPAKLAARDEVLRLRQAGRSVTEITAALSTTATPLNRTGVWELLVAEGHERLAPRAPGDRGAPARDHPPRTRVMRWPQQSLTLRSDHAGAMLLLPALVALDLPGAVAGARLPGTREVPALSSVLSLLALKAIGRRRVSHVDDVCTDPPSGRSGNRVRASLAGGDRQGTRAARARFQGHDRCRPRRAARRRPDVHHAARPQHQAHRAALEALPDSAWTQITLERRGP